MRCSSYFPVVVKVAHMKAFREHVVAHYNKRMRDMRTHYVKNMTTASSSSSSSSSDNGDSVNTGSSSSSSSSNSSSGDVSSSGNGNGNTNSNSNSKGNDNATYSHTHTQTHTEELAAKLAKLEADLLDVLDQAAQTEADIDVDLDNDSELERLFPYFDTFDEVLYVVTGPDQVCDVRLNKCLHEIAV